ncbi:hypothetical protein BDZ97DRAFT_1776025 [Flammula alnicola]|nr:hypothetical protein BDZ97DRAFT_1776025 [Flammula alnicola]
MSSPFSCTNKYDPVPLVIVQGFLGTTGVVSWDYHINKFGPNSLERRKIILPNIGPVSSLHDRACELYYSLVGGRVDYGVQHSLTHRHARYGRTFTKGLYPEWSKENPLHFVGHSIGGPTITKLQHLLHDSHFGEEGHPDMILSINAVCSPFRGTQLVYTLGESTTAAPSVHPFSVGSMLAKLVHVLAYLSPVLPSIFDVHADARSFSYRESSPASLARQLWKSDWAESTDAAPYDMTFQAAEERETSLEGRVYPNTFYRSHVSRMTCKMNSDPRDYQHRPRNIFSFTHNLLYFCSKSIGTFDYNLLEPPPSFSNQRNAGLEIIEERLEQGKPAVHEIQGEDYWANDGVVPIFSQWHPLPCRMTTCDHHKGFGLQPFEKRAAGDDTSCNLRPHPGNWTVITVDDTNHLSLIIPGLFRENVYQRTFWTELGHWLDTVEKCTSVDKR